jgi:hypothetical protein
VPGGSCDLWMSTAHRCCAFMPCGTIDGMILPGRAL